MKLFRRGSGERGSTPSEEQLAPQKLAEQMQAAMRPVVEQGRVLVFANGDICTTDLVYRQNPGVFNRAAAKMRSALGVSRVVRIEESVFEGMLSGRARTVGAAKTGIDREDSTLNRLAKDVLQAAITRNASDTYIDIGKRTILGYRTSGIKRPATGSLSREDGFSIARSIWSACGSMFEESKPCDGAMHFADRMFRCSSLNTIGNGAGIVLRMRDPSFRMPLLDVGYSPQQVGAIEEISSAPGGMMLITGETNSGKSSTLATLMGELPANQKIIEISDPVEVIFDHVTQVEIERYASDAAERFEAVLGALVRQNPDTLILGEVRDEATVNAATSMALQGKRVFTTLHTQSARLAFSRLGDMGMDKTLLYQPGFVSGVVNQNLVPVLCPACRTKEPQTEIGRKLVGERHAKMFFGNARYASGRDCGAAKCSNGIVGQTLVAEVLPMVRDTDGRFIHKLKTEEMLSELVEMVRDEWRMERKVEHAYRKVLSGSVDAEYVERIIGRFQEKEVAHLLPKSKEDVPCVD